MAGDAAREPRRGAGNAGKSLVLLLGMHRSGTSLAARCFAAAGLPLGERLLREPRPDNADGYWEDADIVAAQEALLNARFGGPQGQWDCAVLEDVTPALCPGSAWADALETLTGVARERLADGLAFGFKDPRTARLLPLWQEVARRLELKLVPVLLLRHPSEVAASLLTRNLLPRMLGELMWLRNVADVLRDAGQGPEATMDYAAWFDDPDQNERTVHRVLCKVGIAPAAIPRSLIRIDHRHAHTSPALLPLAEEIYRALVGERGNPPAKRVRDALLARIDGLVEAFGGWRALGEALTRTDALPQEPSVRLPLPIGGREPPSRRTQWHVIPCAPEIVNGNRWCQPAAGGFQLHPNEPGMQAARLVWPALYCSKAARLSMDLAAASAQCPGLEVELVSATSGGEVIDSAQARPLPGQPATVSVGLRPDAWHEVRLSVMVAAGSANAYYAGLLVSRPRVEILAG